MYVNIYIIPVPAKDKEEYAAKASVFADVAMDHGAVQLFENWETEVPDGKHTDYRQAVKAAPGEKIVVSWVVWPDRETGASAHKSMFEDPRLVEGGLFPIDGSRMILGGFSPLVTRYADTIAVPKGEV